MVCLLIGGAVVTAVLVYRTFKWECVVHVPTDTLVQCPRCHGLGLTKGDPYGFLCPHCGREFIRLP